MRRLPGPATGPDSDPLSGANVEREVERSASLR
jgi:hypothetical protein